MAESKRNIRTGPATSADKGLIAGPALLAVTGALLSLGLALDMSAAYQTANRLSRAFDTAATVGARQTAFARSVLSDVIIDTARSSFDDPSDLTNIRLDVDQSATDTIRVRLSGNATAPRRFGRLIGRDSLSVQGNGEATRYPIDMIIVVDLSYSLHRNGGLPALPEALSDFIQYFEQDIDRVGLVTYSTWASEILPLQKNFGASIADRLAELTPVTDAATGEGLRVAKQSLDSAGRRPEAERVIVLFTDGPPTAYGDRFRMSDHTTPRYFDGVVAAYINGASYRGLFSNADGRKIRYFNANGMAITTDNASYAQSIAPKYLPGKHRVDGHNIRSQAASNAESWASVIRSSGHTIYVVGYRGATFDPGHEADLPESGFLHRIANHDGVADPTAPAGRAILAQHADDLGSAFASIANDILATATR